jgi:hypothetical protein
VATEAVAATTDGLKPTSVDMVGAGTLAAMETTAGLTVALPPAITPG